MHGLFPWPMPSHSAHPMYADQQKESLQCSHLTNHQNLHEGLNHQNQFHNHQKGKVQFQSEKGLQAMPPLWPFLCPHLHPQLRLETPTSSAHCQQECVAPSGSRSPSHAPTLTVTPFTPPLWSQGPRPSVELVRIQNVALSSSRSQVMCPLWSFLCWCLHWGHNHKHQHGGHNHVQVKEVQLQAAAGHVAMSPLWPFSVNKSIKVTGTKMSAPNIKCVAINDQCGLQVGAKIWVMRPLCQILISISDPIRKCTLSKYASIDSQHKPLSGSKLLASNWPTSTIFLHQCSIGVLSTNVN